MADGRKHFLLMLRIWVFILTALVNQARALRVAEIMNDYRTLLLHISQLNVSVPAADQAEEGFRVLRESLGAANALMSSSYNPSPPPANSPSDEAEKAQLQRYHLPVVHNS